MIFYKYIIQIDICYFDTTVLRKLIKEIRDPSLSANTLAGCAVSPNSFFFLERKEVSDHM